MDRGERERGEVSSRSGWKLPRPDLAAGAGTFLTLLHPHLPEFTAALPDGEGLVLFPEPPPPEPLSRDLSPEGRAAFLARLAGLAAFLKFHGLGIAFGDAAKIGSQRGDRSRPALGSAAVPEWRAAPPALLVAAVAARLGGARVAGKSAGALRDSVRSSLADLDSVSAPEVAAALSAADAGGGAETLVGDFSRRAGGQTLGPDLLGIACPPDASGSGDRPLFAAGAAALFVIRGAARRSPGAGFVECRPGPPLVDGAALARLARALEGDPRAASLGELAAGRASELPSGPPVAVVAVDADAWDPRSRRAFEGELGAAGFRRFETRRDAPPPWLERTAAATSLDPADVASLLWLPFRSLAEASRAWEAVARHARGDAGRFLAAARSLAAAFDPAARVPVGSFRFVEPRADPDPLLDAASLLASGFGALEAAVAAGVGEPEAIGALRAAAAAGRLEDGAPGTWRFRNEADRARRASRLTAAARRHVVERLEREGLEGDRFAVAALARATNEDLEAARASLASAAERGDAAIVAELLERAPSRDPDLGRPDLAVELHVERGRLEEARRAARRISSSGTPPLGASRRRALARRIARLGEGEAALALVARNGTAGELLANAQVLLDLRRTDEAVGVLSRLPPALTADERLAEARLGAEAASRRGELDRAASLLARVEGLLPSGGDAAEAFETAMTAGHLAVDRTRYPEARTWFRRARDAAGDVRHRADATLNLSVASLHEGRFADADAELSASLSLYAEAGDEERYLSALGNRIDLAMRTGRFAEARETLDTLLAREKRPGREHQFLFCVPPLQELALLAGDGEAAAEAFREAEARRGAADPHDSWREILILEAARLLGEREPGAALELLTRAGALADNRELSEPRRLRLAASARIDLGREAGPLDALATGERALLAAEAALARKEPFPEAATGELSRRIGPGAGAAAVAGRVLEWTRRFPDFFATPKADAILALGERAAAAAGLPEAARRISSARRAASVPLPRPAPVPGEREEGFVAEDPATRAVLAQARRIAPTGVPILILGETGTGKEIVARAIHRYSGRCGPFVAVNVSALAGTLIESELFGHARGAFTGADRDRSGLVEESSGGTLFLDEIGDLPLPLQGKLLRVLQEREVRRVGETRVRRVDLRVVAATHRDLPAMSEAGTFRPDLLYRLRGLELVLEPLRNRPRDLRRLVEEALDGASLSPSARDLVWRYRWPGNIRELASALESARALAAPGRVVEPEHLPAAVRGMRVPAAPASYRLAVADAKREAIRRALDESGGNRTQAAKRLGLSRQSLLYEMKVLGLAVPPGRKSRLP